MVDNTTMEFQGKDIADAISKACKALKVSQEDLDIEVLTTGTTGIFGLMKQKATLRVSLKKELQDKPERKKKREKRPAKRQEQPAAAKEEETGKAAEPEVQEPAPPPREKEVADVSVPASDELLEQAKKDLDHILELMGCPSEVTVSSDINAVDIQIQGEYVKEITNQNGKILDSLQYLLRKIISQKFPEKATISIDADNFREKRIEELKELGLKLAEEAKNTGKTRSISSLNPSERRIVHVALQDDKDIRSRSVGDGLFKKVLIYKPGSKNKKSSSRRRRGPRKPNNK